MNYDLLLKGGHVIDPRNSIDEPMDIAIAQGRIAEVAEDIKVERAEQVVHVEGLYITPGLVDLHCHLYATPGHRDAWAGDNSVLPDGFSFRTGVTTMVDAGSSGWRNFEDFRYRVIDRAKTRVLAMINITGLGMLTDIVEQNVYDMDPQLTSRMAKEHADVIVGVKSAHYFGPEWVSIEKSMGRGVSRPPRHGGCGLFPGRTPLPSNGHGETAAGGYCHPHVPGAHTLSRPRWQTAQLPLRRQGTGSYL